MKAKARKVAPAKVIAESASEGPSDEESAHSDNSVDSHEPTDVMPSAQEFVAEVSLFCYLQSLALSNKSLQVPHIVAKQGKATKQQEPELESELESEYEPQYEPGDAEASRATILSHC
jgi:hypothetical protein